MQPVTILALLAAFVGFIAALKPSVSPLTFRNRQVMMISAICFKSEIFLSIPSRFIFMRNDNKEQRTSLVN
jgi:hypothetical protein